MARNGTIMLTICVNSLYSMYHLLYCHLWWSVPYDQHASIQIPVSLPVPQLPFDFGIWCFARIDG